jgi:CBS domain-containing protein
MDNLAAAEGLLEPEPEILDLPIGALMSRRVITVTEDASLGELAEMLLFHRIHRVVVVRADRIVGIISVLDILQTLRDQHLTPAT